jgi:hypothetical protein
MTLVEEGDSMPTGGASSWMMVIAIIQPRFDNLKVDLRTKQSSFEVVKIPIHYKNG